MRLMELFSSDPTNQDPRLSKDINYLDDLKFYMDNDNEQLTNVLFPAIKAHKENIDDESAYRHYMKPIKITVEKYCNQFDLDDIKDKMFTDENLIQLAKRFAEEQKAHIGNKDYD